MGGNVNEQSDSVRGKREADVSGGSSSAAMMMMAKADMPTTMSEINGRVPDTPSERLRNLLEEAVAVCKGQEEYVAQCTSAPSEAAAALEHKTRSADWVGLSKRGETMFEFSERWTTDAVEAKMLGMFAYMLRARRVLEVGMFTGYGTLTIAESLPDDGVVISCEIDPFLKQFAAPIFASSPHGHKIDVRVGDALSVIETWPENEPFDMVFIDADKGSYAAYYETVLSRKLLAPGGVIVVDNTLFKGTPYVGEAVHDGHNWNDGGVAIAAFNEMVAKDERVEQVMLPVRDGVTIVRLKGEAPQQTRPVPDAAARPSIPSVPVPVPVPVPVEAPAIAPPPGSSDTDNGSIDDEVMRGAGGKRILDRLRLNGRNALVTGGGQGIGRAFCHALAEAGASVCVADIALERAEQVAAELELKGCRAFALRVDCTDKNEIGAMVRTVVSRWGQLHIAVNNAGVNKNSAAEDTPMEDWDLTFGLNTRGVFVCCQEEAKHMLANGYGKIINTASMASLLVPHPQKQAAYNCSKSAVVKMTQTLACEWIDRGVNVNCISPGIVDTPLIWDNPELNTLAELWLEQIPAKRLAKVSDLQAAIVYLASDASSYMVGHNLVIEGGQSLW